MPFTEITALVAERSGLVFAAHRRGEAEAGIARAMKSAHTTDGDDYLRLIRGDGTALDDLVDAMTVAETHFMRDPDQLAWVRSEVLPGIVRRRGARAAPRVWSAGCATGEEAYTLAILVEQEGMARGAVVLGTDLSALALEKARAASFSDWSIRGPNRDLLEEYFRPIGRRRVLVERLRNAVRFERLNLIGPEPYAAAGAYGMDLILCRNVLLYFDRVNAGHIAARLFDALAPGGILLTAGTDPLLGKYAPFEVTVTRVGLVYRRPLAAAEPVQPAITPGAPEPSSPRADPDLALGQEAFQRVLSQANGTSPEAAEQAAQAELRLRPLDARLHYLRAALLVSLDRDREAEEETQRALYLDRSLAVAHFLLGTLLRKRGARPGARRAFRNARDLCAARPFHEEVPAGDGANAGALHAAAAAEMDRLGVPVV